MEHSSPEMQKFNITSQETSGREGENNREIKDREARKVTEQILYAQLREVSKQLWSESALNAVLPILEAATEQYNKFQEVLTGDLETDNHKEPVFEELSFGFVIKDGNLDKKCHFLVRKDTANNTLSLRVVQGEQK
jgi:hypothetical protein